MKYYISLLFVALFIATQAVYAQKSIHGAVIDTHQLPIIGANVFWKNSTKGTVTDLDGKFELPFLDKSDTLVVSYIGYEPHWIIVEDRMKPVFVSLTSGVMLGEIVVAPQNQGALHLKLTTINTQKITKHELTKAACCNLGESFETNPSVDVTYSDAATGARQIQLLGLSGKYVQMLAEQIPSFTGAANLYGLSYVPGPWLESIQISKGPSSVKNGFESISGQINIDLKKPQEAELLSLNLFGASNGRVEANADINLKINSNLATGTMLHYSSELMDHDQNGDGFTDSPRTEQFNILHRWYYKKNGFISQSVANVLSETRKGGEMNHHKGSDEQMAHPYRVNIKTNRASFSTKNGYLFGNRHNTSIAMMLSGSFHDQTATYGNRAYDVLQKSIYAGLIFEQDYDHIHNISAGMNISVDDYTENYDLSTAIVSDRNRSRTTDIIPGVYGQYTLNIDHKLVLQAGLRADYHKEFGAFVTPRLHLKYEFAPWLTSRVSAGKGYRVSREMVENSFLFASSRAFIVSEELDRLERAWNYGVAFASNFEIVQDKSLQMNMEWYYTSFENQVLADQNSDPQSVFIKNSPGKSFAHIAQFEATYPFFKGFTMTGAVRFTDAKTDYGSGLEDRYLTSRWKGMLTASYQTNMNKWQFDATLQFNGKGSMPHPDKIDPLWDENYQSFTGLNAQITKNYRKWAFYIGGENLLNFRQKDTIVDAANPWGDHFDSTMIWGPIHGIKGYAGLRYSL